MAVEIREDGTIYCNTVRYSYKQARNLIADSSGDCLSGCWISLFEGNSPINSSHLGFGGYKSYRYLVTTDNLWIIQKIPKLINEHIYYFSLRGKGAGFVLIGGKNKENTIDHFYAHIEIGHEDNWNMFSSYFTSSSDDTIIEDEIVIGGCNFNQVLNNTIYVSRLILIDLTDTFGKGNEPSKEWCDKNILEHETFVNWGTKTNAVQNSNIGTIYQDVNFYKRKNFKYCEFDYTSFPREFIYELETDEKQNECFLYSQNKFSLNPNYNYYFRAYYNVIDSDFNSDFYFPEAEPSLPTCNFPLLKGRNFNSGGGMSDWKLVSFYGPRNMFDSGSYQVRFDINNDKKRGTVYLTAFNLTELRNGGDCIVKYNEYNGTNINVDDVNKEWCDRWIGGRSDTIIHIKDPKNTSIQFNKDYDIICNDIEIRPELNKVEFDFSTGTIRCKKLIKEQIY